ncbi:MAG: hypothetical protein ACYS8X_13635 [Planctomycetota bacterium]
MGVEPKVSIERQLKIFRDFAIYARRHWQVTPKLGAARPFLLNGPQRIVNHEMLRQLRAGRQPRLKVLKSRQQGISTMACGLCQQACQTRRGHHAISIADKLELPKKWLRRARKWVNQTPAHLRPHLAASNAIELYFDALDSNYWIGSQMGQTPGMGHTLHRVHCSELSNWNDPEQVMSDLLPAVPKSDPAGMVLFESTGEMAGDWWHQQVTRTAEGDDDFALVFLPWFISDDYAVDTQLTPADYTDDERDAVSAAAAWASRCPEHAALVGFEQLSPAQIAWRRWVIVNEFSCDVDRFKSRYPTTVEEAFLSVGNLALPAVVVRHHGPQVRPPVRRVRFEDVGGGRIEARDVDHDRSEDVWQIAHEPSDRGQYTIGADVAEGIASDPRDARSDRDYSAAAVLNRDRLRFDAVYVGRPNADLFGEQLMLAGRYYNSAWLAPEVNNCGWATLVAMKDYPNIVPRSRITERLDLDGPRDITQLGWRTDAHTRNLLIDDWIRLCRPEPTSGFDGKVEIFSELLVQQEKTFIINAAGRREHRPGCHDDLLFAHMIAVQAHLSCPRISEGAERFVDVDSIAAAVRPSWAYVGGVDRDRDSDDDE